MNIKEWQRYMMIALVSLVSTETLASSALLSIKVIKPAPLTLARNDSAGSVYQVTNRTKSLRNFVMQSIPGITQITTTTGACSNPILLNQGESCLLNLRIRGNQIPKTIIGGPVLCNNNPSPFACSKPSAAADSLHIVSTVAEESPNSNTWFKVLVADTEAPTDATDLATFISKTYTLAPNVEQIHLRVVAGANGCSAASPASCQVYADLIAALRTKYTNPLLIGYHPDDSKTSYSNWGCNQNDWQCVLNASIVVMNEINKLADPTQTGQGFNLFSLEQSYAVPEDPPTIRLVKSCLNPPKAAPNVSCPAGVTIASPYVNFGWVLPSYGGCPVPPLDCDNAYGSDALDYGYPQNYNLGPKIVAPYTDLITDGFFPVYSTGCISHAPYPTPLYVVDEDNGSVPYSPEIPCPDATQTTSNVFTYLDPSTHAAPNLTLATAYLSYIMTQQAPISDIPNTNGSPVYLMFSGEGLAQAPSIFLGGTGWTLQNILSFYQGINADFSVLYGKYPPTSDPLFRGGVFTTGVNPSAINYGIWNFTPILDNMPD